MIETKPRLGNKVKFLFKYTVGQQHQTRLLRRVTRARVCDTLFLSEDEMHGSDVDAMMMINRSHPQENQRFQQILK